MSKQQYLTDYLHKNAANHPDKTALVFNDEVFTWQQLDDLVVTASAALADKVPSDKQCVIGLLFANGWEFIVAYLAILDRGHIAMPFDVTHKALEIGAIIDQMKPQLIITNNRQKSVLPASHPTILLSELLNTDKPATEGLRLTPETQIATLLFTSGTTGKPKATPYTHANHIWNIKVTSKVVHWNNDDTMLLSLPLSHWHGLVMGLSGIIYHGNTLYLHERFDPVKTLQALSSGNISIYTHISIAYIEMVKQPESADYDVSNVKVLISASSALPPAVSEEFKRRFHHDILECYGSSETGRIASNTPEDLHIGTPGKLLPGVKARVNKDNELEIVSPGLFPGYYNNDLATKEKFTPDGWWKTGDIVELKDGYLLLKGRIQERIKRNGLTLYPRDIEWALMQHPKMKEAFVMGVQQQYNPSDTLVYFLVTTLSVGEVVDFSKQSLPAAWRADHILILDIFPKLSNGKPKLGELKKMAEQRIGDATSERPK